jgi:heme exporter protein CcmD
MSLKEFIEMGDYGAYIWSCYGLTLAILVLNAWTARRGLAEQLLHAKRRLKIGSESPS